MQKPQLSYVTFDDLNKLAPQRLSTTFLPNNVMPITSLAEVDRLFFNPTVQPVAKKPTPPTEPVLPPESVQKTASLPPPSDEMFSMPSVIPPPDVTIALKPEVQEKTSPQLVPDYQYVEGRTHRTYTWTLTSKQTDLMRRSVGDPFIQLLLWTLTATPKSRKLESFSEETLARWRREFNAEAAEATVPEFAAWLFKQNELVTVSRVKDVGSVAQALCCHGVIMMEAPLTFELTASTAKAGHLNGDRYKFIIFAQQVSKTSGNHVFQIMVASDKRHVGVEGRYELPMKTLAKLMEANISGYLLIKR